jgi:hypothetical protein
MAKSFYKKYNRSQQKAMAVWAADCAKRVLPLFEAARPNDDRPRRAIAACRKWARTGVFKMAEIRARSLGAHASARRVKANLAACFATRAAGQAVATAHVTQHAYGAALYALKAIMESEPGRAAILIAKEHDWQARHLPSRLRKQIMSRIVIVKDNRGIRITINKDNGF